MHTNSYTGPRLEGTYKVAWCRDRWERGKVIENNGKKLLWDWEHSMKTSCKARRPDLMLEDSEKKEIVLIDMACPNESNKNVKREQKIRKYQHLCFELRERREGYKVKVIPSVIGCLGGGMKILRNDIRELFNSEKDLNRISRETQKTVLWENETIIRKILSGLLT